MTVKISALTRSRAIVTEEPAPTLRIWLGPELPAELELDPAERAKLDPRTAERRERRRRQDLAGAVLGAAEPMDERREIVALALRIRSAIVLATVVFDRLGGDLLGLPERADREPDQLRPPVPPRWFAPLIRAVLTLRTARPAETVG